MKIDEAKKLIETENKKELETCQKEIQAVLDKYKCKLAVQPNILINGQPVMISIIK